MPSRVIKIIIIAIRNTWKIACRIHFLCHLSCKMKDSVVVEIVLGHEHEEWCLCPRTISTITESFILQDKWHRKWILQAIFQVFLIAIMMIFITLLGIVASVNAIRAINQDLTTAKTEARQSNEHKIP
jgi:hypothetical protein